MQLHLPYHHQDVQLPHLLQDVSVEDGLEKAIYTTLSVQKRLSFRVTPSRAGICVGISEVLKERIS